jgi:hypothetical protein
MSDSIISQLFDFGALGAFAAFLVWQHLGMQKRLDSLTEKFQEQMAGLVNKFQSRIEIMRGRYDDVIEGYRTEALDCQKQMAIHRQDLSKVVAGNAEALSEHTGLLQDIGGEVSAGLHEMREQHKEMEIERRAKRPGKSS